MRCLIAQSDATLCAMLCDTLEAMGHSATCAETAADARRRLQHTSYDLVVLDHALPAREAGRLAHLAIERSKEARVLTLTGCEVFPQQGGARLAPAIMQLLQDVAPRRAKRPHFAPAPLHRDLAWLS